MKTIILAIALLAAGTVLADVDVDKMVAAIKVAEGIHSRFPYGVLSVKVNSEDEARAVCRRSVVNNLARWHKAGEKGDFVSFMASRWCPIASDPIGNARWIKNVNAYMKAHQ